MSLTGRLEALPCFPDSTAGAISPEAAKAQLAPCSNVIPMRGHVLLIAPLAYLYATTPRMYAVFRAMYCRYWHRLTTISSHPEVRLGRVAWANSGEGVGRVMGCWEIRVERWPRWNHAGQI